MSLSKWSSFINWYLLVVDHCFLFISNLWCSLIFWEWRFKSWIKICRGLWRRSFDFF